MPGFTLIELVIVIAMLGMLTALVFPALTPMRDRAERVVCIGNLRSLYVSLNTYLIDNKHWPQVPDDIDQTQLPKFWVQALSNYGATEKVWTCPSLKRRYTEKPENFLEYPEIHYMPGEFDANPLTPHKWPAMPWAMEIGSMHGDGNMIIRADGGLRNLNDLLKEAGGEGVHALQ